MAVTDSILKQIETLGYMCVTLNEGGTLAMVAEPTISIDVVVDGTNEERRYRGVCQLALRCRIDLEDG